MELKTIKRRFQMVTVYLELILALFIAVAVIIGMVDLYRYIVLIYTTNAIETYDVFQKFLGHALLLVVGVELVAMLILHTPGSVIEVLLYAVARNMLIGGHGTLDFVFGIAAIAGIFAIRKFLFTDSIASHNGSLYFSAATPIEEVNKLVGVKIPEDIGNTLGGVICHLSKQTCRPMHEGASYVVADASIRILKMKDNLIEKVSVSENDEID